MSEAVVVWTGHGSTAWPVRRAELVQARFGDLAVDLMPLVRLLADAFDESDASIVVRGDLEMCQRARDDFTLRHPEVSEAAVEALVWCYSWDNR